MLCFLVFFGLPLSLPCYLLQTRRVVYCFISESYILALALPPVLRSHISEPMHLWLVRSISGTKSIHVCHLAALEQCQPRPTFRHLTILTMEGLSHRPVGAMFVMSFPRGLTIPQSSVAGNSWQVCICCLPQGHRPASTHH